MIQWENLCQHGMGRMKYLLRELETAPYLGRTRGEILKEEKQDLKQTTIREICFEKDEGEAQGKIKVQITDDDVTMQVMADDPVGRRRWTPTVLLPEQKALIRKYEGAINE
jgi:hypothetical protein